MLQVNFSPFPLLTTERLQLRPVRAEDEDALFILRTDESVNKYLDRIKARSLDDVRRFVQKINSGISNNESIYWAISYKDDMALVGTACLWNLSAEENRAELGYELLPAYQGKGIMQEALAKIIEYGFLSMKAEILEAAAHIQNERSFRVLEKLGFRRDEDRKAVLAETDNMSEMVVYTLRRNDYPVDRS